VDSTESTVARRGRHLLDSGLVRVTGQPDPARVGLGYPVLVQLSCEAGAVGSVARTLAARPDVRFLAMVTSTFDILLEVIVMSRRHLAHVLVNEFSSVEGVTRTTTSSVLRTFKTSYDWSRELLDDQGIDPSFGDELRPAKPQLGDPLQLDQIDLQLIQLLGDDGRRSYSELAGVLGTSESMVRRRFSALVDGGYLTFATLVEPQSLGYEIEALILLRVNLGELERIATALAEHREVRYLSATSGFSDLVGEVILRSPDELYAFTTETLGSLEGIQRALVAYELVTVKRAYIAASRELLPEEGIYPTSRDSKETW
jgi:DNA-binding Lrp family transcriptional regulator